MKKYDAKELLDMAMEINLYNGDLPEFDVFDTWGLDDLLHDTEATRIMNMVHSGDYNPRCEYHRFNGYGNIESIYKYQLYNELLESHDYIVELAKDLGILGED